MKTCRTCGRWQEWHGIVDPTTIHICQRVYYELRARGVGVKDAAAKAKREAGETCDLWTRTKGD